MASIEVSDLKQKCDITYVHVATSSSMYVELSIQNFRFLITFPVITETFEPQARGV